MQHLQSEFDSLVGGKDKTIDRRDFIKTAVGVGFAAAVLPVCAKTLIRTDAEGLKDGEFTLEIAGQPVPVYMAQPKDKENLPVVIVISEIFGLHEHITDVVRRFAKQGYLAVAPELFIRQGDPSIYDNIAQIMKEVVSKVPDKQVLGDLDACVAWAKRNGGNPDKIAVAGFCWGGRFAWLYAAHNPSIKAGVAWYGRLTSDTAPSALNPENPIDIAPTLTTPMLGLYGGKDPGISMASIQQMKDALAKGASLSEIVVYPKSGHAFHADYRPSYVADDAKDSWKRCLEWLRAHGVE
ncbi:dienelactone hydrolase family protein [Solimicrobium silvestre]|uniref:Dienelactone hydrolase n=1 Tax=Solimicrobium silvestre TaxID=2099400 RepID=A0A2S9H112_9BURK|nr:dienelactone hydrolase family protein [Solimicrobium silvestre]PRC93647.1 Dienelactone hydrolase [Solimicrobium silvestre]